MKTGWGWGMRRLRHRDPEEETFLEETWRLKKNSHRKSFPGSGTACAKDQKQGKAYYVPGPATRMWRKHSRSSERQARARWGRVETIRFWCCWVAAFQEALETSVLILVIIPFSQILSKICLETRKGILIKSSYVTKKSYIAWYKRGFLKLGTS